MLMFTDTLVSLVVLKISTAFHHLEIPVHIRKAAALQKHIRGEVLLVCCELSLYILCQLNTHAFV